MTVSEAEEDLIQEAVASEPTLDPLILRPGPYTICPWVHSCGCCLRPFTASLTSFLCFTPHSGISSHKFGKGSSGSFRPELIPQVKEVKHPRITDLCSKAGLREQLEEVVQCPHAEVFQACAWRTAQGRSGELVYVHL